MNIYIKELISRIGERYGELSGQAMTEKLIRMGLLDHTLCKVLTVREHVANLMISGDKKVDAMWKASERFCCTYEYVRKCVYYYQDINFE